ncbi:MFS transporter [Phenylobacterium montanum]|uniref:MFS transporter n=1 Tax=Phenylobacterium montanum TaxID=2823693 RepID=UPI002012F7B8|nr:MFS transporter [Caulobacter sp. S6]
MIGSLVKVFATGAAVAPIADAAEVDKLYRRHRTRIMLAITIGYALSYTCRLGLSVVKKPLIDGGYFTPEQLGSIGSALFYTYAFGKLTNGFLGDHANVKRFFAFGLMVSALCNFGMGALSTFWFCVVVWGLNGWFQSFGAPSSIVSLSNWFSNRERGTYYGIWGMSHQGGEALTFWLASAIVAALGWRWGFWGPAAICAVAALAVFLLTQDRPQTLGLPPVADWRKDHWGTSGERHEENLLAIQFSILKRPALWIVALSSAAMYVTRYAINSWGILYLQEIRGFSLPDAGLVLTASMLGGVAGTFCFGFISDKLFASHRPPTNLIYGLVELGGLLLVFYGPTGLVPMMIGFIAFGFGMGGLITSLGGLFAIDICPKRAAGAALGTVGVFSYLGAAVQEQISGHLIQAGLHVAGGHKHYDFGPAILFWVGASAVSLVLATSLWRVRVVD